MFFSSDYLSGSCREVMRILQKLHKGSRGSVWGR